MENVLKIRRTKVGRKDIHNQASNQITALNLDSDPALETKPDRKSNP